MEAATLVEKKRVHARLFGFWQAITIQAPRATLKEEHKSTTARIGTLTLHHPDVASHGWVHARNKSTQ